MKLIYVGLWLVLIILGIVFAALNAEQVQLNYYFGNIQLPISLVMSIALLLGACLGVLACLGMIFRSRRDMAKLKKQIEATEKEVVNLRAIPIRDKH